MDRSIPVLTALAALLTGVLPHAPAGAREVTPVDSTAIARFLELPQEEVELNRLAAAEHARAAEEMRDGPLRRSHWQEAVALDPARTDYWLALSETEMEMGYLREAVNALASAKATLGFLEGDALHDAIRDYSVWIAWWDFEMGRFEKGLAWGDRAVEYGAGLDGHLIANLNFARLTDTWNDLRKKCVVFSPLDSGGNRRANYSWCLVNFAMKNNFPPFDPEGPEWWLHRSKGHYELDVWRWRDYGHYCEMNGARRLAVSFYERSIESHPYPDGGWITRVEFHAPITAAPNSEMPFWINPRGGFVTGSVIAWCGFMHAQMRAATSAAERRDFAEHLEAGTARSVERFPQSPWLRLWRADALGQLGRTDEAVAEVVLAREKFDRRRIVEPEIDRIEGRVRVLAGRFSEAVSPLQRATESFPRDALCWTDLAVAELRTGNTQQARIHLERALEIDDSQPAALYERGLLRWREGDRDGALIDVERAAELAPDRNDIAQMLARLRAASRQEPE